MFLRVSLTDAEALGVFDATTDTLTLPLMFPGGSMTSFVQTAEAPRRRRPPLRGVRRAPFARRRRDVAGCRRRAAPARALAERDGKLFGAADDTADGYALGVSTDLGVSFTPLMKFSDVGLDRAVRAACQDVCKNEVAIGLWPASMCTAAPEVMPPPPPPPAATSGCASRAAATRRRAPLVLAAAAWACAAAVDAEVLRDGPRSRNDRFLRLSGGLRCVARSLDSLCSARLTLIAAGVVGLAALLLACSSSPSAIAPDAGAPAPTARQQALSAARATLAASRPADADAFMAKWPAKTLAKLPYDPSTVQGLDVIAASTLGLSEAEQAALARDGFMISPRQTFPTFFYGYKSLYADHLPLYVSADSVLHAVHRSYDKALMTLELTSLSPLLTDLLAAMHNNLGAGAGAALPAATRADVDLYLTVARSLLGASAAPVAGASVAAVQDLVTKAKAATGTDTVSLFGAAHDVDFSQFTPRGHYNDGGGPLTKYFQAMIWLGRTDLRLLTYDLGAPTAPPTFQRRAFLGALLLAELATGDLATSWTTIDGALRGFVGESDNMALPDFAKLESLTGVSSLDALAALPDATLAQQLLDGDFGIQRIASQLLLVPDEGAGAPLDRVFLFFGQRFVIDSEVLSNVVFDRVRGEPKRFMANALDVAFGALGNAAAAPLLATDLRNYPSYAGALSDARTIVDEHGDDFWGESLYSTWLGALRGLSPPAGDPTTVAGLPSVMKTEPWSRRVLVTQLASWAELRHDTLLYAKQAYGAGITCEFPDAFVDPYPDAWAGIVRLAKLGQAVAAALPADPAMASADGVSGNASLVAYFARVEMIASTLLGMANAELAGQALTADQLAFINQAVDEQVVQAGCTTARIPQGWYASLFLDPQDTQTFDPTIADVYTDAAEGRVLHVGTGYARYMVVTVDTCMGARAYAGLVSSYYEDTTENLERLDDQTWAAGFGMGVSPPDVPWAADLVVH